MPLPEAIAEARAFLAQDHETQSRLERVSRLIEGFEYPHGLELLATVHWVTQENEAARNDVNAAIASVHAWSERKRKTFSPEHIQLAWQRLSDENW